MDDSEKAVRSGLSKLEDEQYEVETVHRIVLVEEQQNEDETHRLLYLINESRQEWANDAYLSQRLENQEYRLRNIQGQRQLFMEEWTDEMTRYKKKLMQQEDDLRTQLRKEQQKAREN